MCRALVSQFAGRSEAANQKPCSRYKQCLGGLHSAMKPPKPCFLKSEPNNYPFGGFNALSGALYSPFGGSIALSGVPPFSMSQARTSPFISRPFGCSEDQHQRTHVNPHSYPLLGICFLEPGLSGQVIIMDIFRITKLWWPVTWPGQT